MECFAQLTYTGTVTTRNGNHISGVVVKIFTVDSSNKLLKFAFTDLKGNFLIKALMPGRYRAELYALGYKPHSDFFDLNTSDVFKSFSLDSVEITLKEVIIVSIPKVAIGRGDTIFYNTNVARNGTERTLGDLLNKLTGVDVDESGIVKAQGQKVGRILIDGKEFFGTKHQMATQNIDADMIASAELYTQFKSDESVEGFDNATTSALNIKLKDKYKDKLTGNLEAGGGYEGRYHLHTNIFKFGKRGNVAFINDANNIGKNAITIGDYIDMRGGILNFLNTSEGNTSGSFTLDDSQIPTVFSEEKVSLKRENYFGAINFTNNLSKKIKIEGYGLLNKRMQSILSNDEIVFLGTTNTVRQQLNTTANALLPNLYSKLYFKPSLNLVVSLTTVVSPLFDKFNTARISNHRLESRGDNDKLSIGNTINLTYSMNNKNLIRVYAFFNSNKRKEELNILSDDSLLNLPFLNNKFLISQKISNNKTSFGIVPSYIYKKAKFKFTFTLPLTGTDEFFRSTLENSNSNNLSYKLTSLAPGSQVQVQINKNIRVVGGASFCNNYIDTSNTRLKYNFLNKNASILYSVNDLNQFAINYSERNNFAELYQAAENSVVVNYQSLQKGSQIDITKKITTKNYEIQYSGYDFGKQKSFFVNMGYKRIQNLPGSNSNPIFGGVLNEFNYIDFNDGLYSRLKLDLKKKFFSLKNTFFINYNKSQLFVNNQKYPYSKVNAQYTFSIASQFKSNHQINFSGSIKLFNCKQFDLVSNTLNSDVGMNYFGKNNKNFNWDVGIKYNYQRNSFATNSILELSPALYYASIRKKYELAIIGNNILNLKENRLIYQNFGEGFRQTSLLNIMPGYITFRYKRNFIL